ncbi:MAG TPA: hypothetical protein VNX68_16690 [Nitrosopumilaceae archaeon]|nr:hypothetical protein [Nitrosopumilaceae archaeon]
MAANLIPSGSQATITIFSKGYEVNYVLLLNNIRLVDVTISMDEEIQQCQCPPGGETYVNEDGMDICVSCSGWVGSSV